MRPVGFIDKWRPQSKTRELLSQTASIIAEYRQYGPMTCRQIFYRLVGNFSFRKDEQAYESLCETLQKARRARLISFDAIRDDGTTAIGVGGYDSLGDLVDSIDASVNHYRLRRDIGQPYRIIVQCEASGMTQMLWQMVNGFGATVRSAGGFDSVTQKYGLARDIAVHDRPTVVLHLGDYDPSGVHVFSNLEADVAAFLGDMDDPGKAIFRRIAVTPEQIHDLQLLTAPAKKTDKRSFAGLNGDCSSTVQCEAIAPSDLEDIVLAEIAKWWDEDIAAELQNRERFERRQLGEWWDKRPRFEGDTI